jgi:homoserine O-succinyltransferase
VPVLLTPAAEAPPDASPAGGPDRAVLTCGFVNNMPDGAFDATERQFLHLLEAGSGSDVIDVRRYTMAGVPRGEVIAARIADQYSSVDTICHEPLDLLIVTGSNPVEVRIEDEPYWGEMVDLLTWGTEHVSSMLLSCLSAHAALTVFDGIERGRLSSKCTGVFAQEVDMAHPLSTGLKPDIVLPHSRMNAVPRHVLERAGYHIAVQSDAVGWSLATRYVASSNVVLVQGHPEYDPSSLIREYQRDARRYVLAERNDRPILPFHCVAAEDRGDLEDLHRAIAKDQRDRASFEAFPFDEVGVRAPWPWRAPAETLYANWLAGVTKRSD